MLQKQQTSPPLSRRERQIMDIVYRLKRPTAAEIHAALPDAPTYSAVRAKLAVLERKGHLRHEQDGPRYLYVPAVPPDRARKSALRHLIDTFFAGSGASAVTALLDPTVAQLTAEDLDRLGRMIEEKRMEKSR
ncbi:MAG: BlaI/MecI/CopY family transcriptional regulator [Acidobacteria bacterium]|nr:BlaI/MecI/CopY family transcriptional regulator [Acidobacteriota bacterium]